MREIKFRAWAGKWYYSNLQSWNNNGIFNYEDINSNTIGQYTGLKDKNGVEIYEGDIVEYRRPMQFKDIAGFWEGGNRTVKDIYNLNFPRDDAQYVEVIDNIYENKELLNAS